ncbi:MAG: hypothetical protein WC341_16305 [Bacteroidales bacterium]|jgi:gas vesicle protein
MWLSAALSLAANLTKLACLLIDPDNRRAIRVEHCKEELNKIISRGLEIKSEITNLILLPQENNDEKLKSLYAENEVLGKQFESIKKELDILLIEDPNAINNIDTAVVKEQAIADVVSEVSDAVKTFVGDENGDSK